MLPEDPGQSLEIFLSGRSGSQEGYQAGATTTKAYYARWVNQAGSLHIKDIRILFISTTEISCLFFFALKFVSSWSVFEFSSYEIPLVIRSSFPVQYRKEFKHNDKWQLHLDVEE